MTDTFALLAVNTAPLRPLDMGAQEVLSGIFKTPQEGAVELRRDGLAGDRIGDTAYHGGVDQAVYLYGQPDIDHWNSAAGGLEGACGPGYLGENLTLDGWWPDLRIGDRLHIGAVALEISAPRTPCATLAARVGQRDFVRRFAAAGRPGAYARVLVPGALQAGQDGELERASAQHPTLVAVFDLLHGRTPPAERAALIAATLAAPVARRVRRKLELMIR